MPENPYQPPKAEREPQRSKAPPLWSDAIWFLASFFVLAVLTWILATVVRFN